MAKKRKTSRRKRQTFLQQYGLWLALAAVVIIVVVIAAWPSTAVALEISVDEAYRMYQEGAFFLDVREPNEWDEYHIPGSIHIPLGELASRTSELPQGVAIVVVCRSGNRSQEGRGILRQAGFENAISMAGGVSTWRDAGYPIETGP